MRFTDLLQNSPGDQLVGSPDREVSALVCDSRQVTPGALFFALPGAKLDGAGFVDQAIAAGAAAVVCQQLPEDPRTDICFLQTARVRRTMALMAACFYGQPSRGVPVIGVTGTNGKTTCTYLLEAVLHQSGLNPAVFGTVEYRLGDRRLPSTHTTPESIQLLRLMRQFRDQGADAFVIEVSSHALEQHRVDGIDFSVGLFTNLTQDHLDYHQSLENYFSSKRRLFSELLSAGKSAINMDDSYGARLLAEGIGTCSFGTDSLAAIHPLEVTSGRDGICGLFRTPVGDVSIDSPLIGHFNVSNLLATVAAAQLLGIDNQTIAAGIAAAPQVPGRLQRIENQREVLALVDYAHTGDALEQVLKTLSQLEHRRLITLVGCGGDRDPGKRPIMAAAATRYSDLAVLTSDNPRTEDPLKILSQMRQGAIAAGARELTCEQLAEKRGFCVEPDRRRAIELACKLAQAGDLLLVAGKGHEDYQILGSEKIHFDDRKELARALQRTCNPAKGGSDV